MRKPSPATIIATVALFVALGGAGMAATGGNFILGQSNSADKSSTLSSSVSNGPTLLVGNTGNRPAARFNTNATAAPFVVSNATKVQNLNADLLDGIDSKGFVHGTGGSNAGVLNLNVGPLTTEYALLSIPGLAGLSARCYLSGGHPYSEIFVNDGTGGAEIYVSYASVAFNGDGFIPVAQAFIAGSAKVGDMQGTNGTVTETGTVQINPTTGDTPVATVFYSVMFPTQGSCLLRASYIENG